LVETDELDLDVLTVPPRGTCLRKSASGFEASCRILHNVEIPTLGLLVLFTAFWSGVSVWGVYIGPLVQGTFNPRAGLFGIPFLLGTVALVSLIVLLTAGKWTVQVVADVGTISTGVGRLRWTRRFKPSGVKSVRLGIARDEAQLGVVLEGDGTLVLCTWMKPDHKRYIAAVLYTMLVEEGRWT